MLAETIDVSQSIIDQISQENECKLIAFNNNFTPFQIVFFVLKLTVPLSDDEAYFITQEIHEAGSSVVYSGSEERCEEIGLELCKISVDWKIEK